MIVLFSMLTTVNLLLPHPVNLNSKTMIFTDITTSGDTTEGN